jgi:HlyD family secretion protein
VRIELTSGFDKLRSGMNVDTTFLGDQVNNALVVPTVAIVSKDGDPGVLIPDDKNRPQFRSVVLGSTVGNQTQILEGLKTGERVFTDIPADSEWNKPKQ